MATLNLLGPSPNGQHVSIAVTFDSMSEGKLLFTSVTLDDASTVANTFPAYVDSGATDNMRVPASHIVSIA